MLITEIKGDLFSTTGNCPLAHCISSDFAMGAGIAVEFKNLGTKTALIEKFGEPMALRDGYINLWNEHSRTGFCLFVNVPTIAGNLPVYNIVTKERYFHKPNKTTMKNALLDMKSQILKNGHKKIAMPKIGCGLDRLKWSDVKAMLVEIFYDTDINIEVYYL